MDRDIEDRVTDWPSRAVSDGYDGLRTLADADFSGAVSIDGTWVFVVGGRVVGIRDGSMEAIEGASGTAYQAPADALPLLFTMQTASETEVRGQYYTEETPLSEVDATLEDAGFTGYLELSDNVLSGDYYLVYHGGRSRPVAIVGTREEVLQGEEAYELAADEVGIYEVIQAPITVTEIPAPAEDDASVSGGVGGGSADDATGETGQAADTGPEKDGGESSDGVSAMSGTDADGERTGDAPGGQGHDGGGQAPEGTTGRRQAEDPTTGRNGPTSPANDRVEDAPTESDSRTEADDRGPSLDSSTGDESPQTNESAADSDSGGDLSDQPNGEDATENGSADAATDSDERSIRRRVETLEEELETEQERAESLARERTGLADELSALKDELGAVESERDELTDRVRELEAQLAEYGQPATEDRTDRPFREAMQETNLFVRYETRSEPTLRDIEHGLDRDRLQNNLEVEVHTAFDRTTVSIDGVPFEEALRSSPEWAFVNWLVRDFPFEIHDTGQTEGLRDLMNAIPDIDRIDLQGAVEVAGSEQETETQVDFDLILRTKTGAPLVVADIHHGRDPVRGESIDDLIDRTAQVSDAEDELGAAFAISPSFFSPDALEAAQTATSSGFLSRDSRLSYVKTDRSRGYHLCLVEGRGDAFHVTVPEL